MELEEVRAFADITGRNTLTGCRITPKSLGTEATGAAAPVGTTLLPVTLGEAGNALTTFGAGVASRADAAEGATAVWATFLVRAVWLTDVDTEALVVAIVRLHAVAAEISTPIRPTFFGQTIWLAAFGRIQWGVSALICDA